MDSKVFLPLFELALANISKSYTIAKLHSLNAYISVFFINFSSYTLHITE